VDLLVKVRRALTLAAFLVALGAVPARAQLLSPGPLSAPHASIDSDDDCGKCHSSGKQVDANKCLSCHKDLGARIASSQGLHGRAYKGKPCEDCHVEHVGRKYKMIRWPGGSMDKLDHGQTGWKLEGKHAQTTCLKCHTQRTMGGRQTFIAVKTQCGSCHKDPHAGRLGQRCEQCHNARDFKEVDRTHFDHNKTRYPLTGKHTTVDCAKCHGTPAKWAPLQFSSCESCHQDPHKGKFKPKKCESCHTTTGWKEASAQMRRNHPGLSLANGHRRVKCETCHDRGIARSPSKGKRCVGCHRNVHKAPFGRRCEGCHASIKWMGLPRDVGLDAHKKTGYPLEGKHLDVDCAKCHSPRKPENARYRQVAHDKCARCHSDAHKGELKAFSGGECGGCHTVRGYLPTTFTVADHAKTAYALDGRHAVVPCGACHKTPAPRTDLRVGKKTCAECHANPHGDQFAKEMADGGCAHCHSSERWDEPKIDHSVFPLVGAHSRTPCERCHGKVAKGAKAAAFRGLPKTCEGCHEDVHAGQFRQTEPKKACDHCHQPETFKLPKFDHAAETGYTLVGKHAKLACGKCHPTVALRSGQKAVRYRLGYQKCKDCHANPHGDER